MKASLPRGSSPVMAGAILNHIAYRIGLGATTE
jgi:hypothetical protein